MARTVRRMGLAQVPAGQPRPVVSSAWAWSTSTSSTRIASIPTRRWKKRWARSTRRFAPAKRYMSASRRIPAPRPAKLPTILRGLGTPLLIHQPSYSLLNRWIEEDLLDALEAGGVGCIIFSPLAQGMLTNKYLSGIPEGSRASENSSLSPELLTEENLARIRALNEIAARRGQSLAQMALAWTLRDPRVTSTLIGVSSVAQLEDSLGALDNRDFPGGTD